MPKTPMPTTPTPTFAELLKRHRLGKGLSQADLVRCASPYAPLSTTYLNLIEAGKRIPSREKVLALAKALELGAAETSQFLAAAGRLPPVEAEEATPTEHRVVRAVLELLGDPRIPRMRKVRAEETLLSFVRWLHRELAAPGENPRPSSSRRAPS